MKQKKNAWFLRAGLLLSALLLLMAVTGCSSNGAGDPDPIPPSVFTAIADDTVFNTLLNRTAFGNGTFVITGADSTAWHSSDGIAWIAASNTAGLQPRAPSDTDGISGLNFVNNQFLATGGSRNNVARAYSSDGDVWTSTNLGTNNADSFNAKAVAFGNGKYLVGGSSGRIAYATALNDTATWTIVEHGATGTTFPSGGTGFINALAFGKGKFVAGGGSGHTAYSTDGAAWESNTQTEEIFSSGFINDIVYGGDKFIAVGENNGTIAWSTDGVNWTQAIVPEGSGNFRAVAYGGGYFVAVGNGPSVVYSTDGITWTTSATDLTGNLFGVAYGNGKFVISGGDGQVAYAVVFE